MSPKTKIQNKWRFSIDRGGTFTDIIGYDLFGNIKTFKVLSGNDHYSIAPAFETIKELVGLASNEFLSSKIIEEIRNSGDKQDYKTNVKAYMTDWQMKDKPGLQTRY